MKKVMFCLLLLIAGNSTVHGQSLTVNNTLNEINNFRTSTLSVLTRVFNNIKNDVNGHFLRSQNTLRIARQGLFLVASDFPYYQLSNEVRQRLSERVGKIIIDVIDPVVDYLQKDSILRYYNFMKETHGPIEISFQSVGTQLDELSEAVKKSTDDTCLRRENVMNRRLATEYKDTIAAVNECLRNATLTYRPPINEFTRVHFIALPFINKMFRELNQCVNANKRDECVEKYLAKFCEEDSCQVSSTITIVKTQAENMVNDVQTKFDECLKRAESKIPDKTPFLENVTKCAKVESSNDV